MVFAFIVNVNSLPSLLHFTENFPSFEINEPSVAGTVVGGGDELGM